MNPVQTEAEIRQLLGRFKIPVETWGKGNAKTLEHLLKDVATGEAVLEVQSCGLVWKTKCAGVQVRYFGKSPNLYLIENRQVFSDGRERHRKSISQTSIMEKIGCSDQNPRKAAERAIFEELGIDEGRYLLQQGSPAVLHVGPIPSMSYPGILSEYFMHIFHWEMPERHFKPEGYVEVQPDKKTYFVWI